MSSCYLQTPMTDFLEQGNPWDGVEIPLDIKDEAVDEDFPPSSALEVIKTDDEVVEDEVVDVDEETPLFGDDDSVPLRAGNLMPKEGRYVMLAGKSQHPWGRRRTPPPWRTPE